MKIYLTLLAIPVALAGCGLSAAQQSCVVDAAVEAVLEDGVGDDINAEVNEVAGMCGVNFVQLVTDQILIAIQSAEKTAVEVQ